MTVKQYELVAERLRQRVVHGELQPGQRLPNEAVLATDFGVSRATVREALRVLATQSLIRTSKGAGGGSYVTLPSVNGVSEYVQSSISLLADSDDVTLEELLEARELLEFPAARLAAERRGEDELKRLRDAIPDEPLRLGTQRQFVYNQDFHLAVIDGCRQCPARDRGAAGLRGAPAEPCPLEARGALPPGDQRASPGDCGGDRGRRRGRRRR